MKQKFANKLVLITGASSGIGEAMAYAFAEQGAIIILLARRVDKLKKVQENIINKNGKAHAYYCDVNNESNLVKILCTGQNFIPLKISS